MTDMKKLIVLMLLALPVFAMAQRPQKVTKGTEGEVVMTNVPKIYCEVYVVEQQGREIVRVVFDNNVGKLIQDKELKVELDNLSKTRFDSVLHAINTLSALGWNIGEIYQMEKRAGVETHILASKEAPKLLKPDLTQSAEKAAGGDRGATKK